VIAAPAMLMTDVCGWDVGTWSRAVRFWESRAPIRGRALELGARRGGLSLWLAAHGCDVLCSDLWGSQCRARPPARPLRRRRGLRGHRRDCHPVHGEF
jgi:hypothetical protein